jgi:serine/threonine protein phosphatase 1
MRTFAMGDIHGQYEALIDCLQQVSFNKKRDQLIQLGDVCDRGQKTAACIEELLTIKKLVAIRGNHDAWLLEFIETGYHPASWGWGGHLTAIDYMRLTGREKLFRKTIAGYKTALSPEDIPATHREFFKRQLPYYLDGKKRCYIHGGFNRLMDFFQQRPEIYYWDRSLWNDALQSETPITTIPSFNDIFIGHSPTQHWHTSEPMKSGNVFNLDTGAGCGGRLTIMNVDTKEWFQSHICAHADDISTPVANP